LVNCLGTMVTTTASPEMFVLRSDGGVLVSAFFVLPSALFPWVSALFPSASASFKALSAFSSLVSGFPATSPGVSSPGAAKGTDAGDPWFCQLNSRGTMVPQTNKAVTRRKRSRTEGNEAEPPRVC
jgi:hypothetical protein